MAFCFMAKRPHILIVHNMFCCRYISGIALSSIPGQAVYKVIKTSPFNQNSPFKGYHNSNDFDNTWPRILTSLSSAICRERVRWRMTWIVTIAVIDIRCCWHDTHVQTQQCRCNSFIPGSPEWDFKKAICNTVLRVGIFRSYGNALNWMPWWQPALVEVMVWCYNASHYLSQCRHISMSPYGVTRWHWANTMFSKILATDTTLTRPQSRNMRCPLWVQIFIHSLR